MMKKTIAAGTIALTLAGAGFALAQQAPRHERGFRPSAEDTTAMTDARVAALKAGLELTAEQEKNWPAVETAIRDLAKARADRMKERADRFAARREARRGGDTSRRPRSRAGRRPRLRRAPPPGRRCDERPRGRTEEARRRRRAALQEPRRRPEAPVRHAAPHGRRSARIRRRPSSLAASRRRAVTAVRHRSGGGDRPLPVDRRMPEAAGPVPAAFS